MAAIQNFIDGEHINIPRKAIKRKVRGEINNSKQEIILRNNKIYEEYKKGISVKKLCEIYFLSDKAIYKIFATKKSGH